MRVRAIRAVGDAVDVQAIPPMIDEQHVDDIIKRKSAKILSKEEDRLEPLERGISHKYHRRKHHELSAADIVGIAHARLVEERQRKDVAEEFRVSIGLVSRIASKAKQSMEYI